MSPQIALTVMARSVGSLLGVGENDEIFRLDTDVRWPSGLTGQLFTGSRSFEFSSWTVDDFPPKWYRRKALRSGVGNIFQLVTGLPLLSLTSFSTSSFMLVENNRSLSPVRTSRFPVVVKRT